MTSVNVATLKQKLSHYLSLVQQGDEVVVLSHHRKVARLIPETANQPLIRPPRRTMADLLGITGIRLPRSSGAVDTLLEDRRKR